MQSKKVVELTQEDCVFLNQLLQVGRFEMNGRSSIMLAQLLGKLQKALVSSTESPKGKKSKKRGRKK